MKRRVSGKRMIKIVSSLFITSLTMLQCVAFATSDTAPGEISNAVNRIVGVIAWFGYAIAFGMFVYIGIKYMMASANERADVKKGAINYVIGAFLIAAAATVARMIVGIAASGSADASGLAGSIIDAATSIAK